MYFGSYQLGACLAPKKPKCRQTVLSVVEIIYPRSVWGQRWGTTLPINENILHSCVLRFDTVVVDFGEMATVSMEQTNSAQFNLDANGP